MKKIFTLVITIFLAFNVFADHVNKDEAKHLAAKFYSAFAPSAKADAKVDKIFIETFKGKESFYIISFDKGGFVIISADDYAVPVLGYSFTNPARETYGANIKYLFDRYKLEIEEVRTLKSENDQIKNDWENLRKAKLKGEIKAAGPLLETTWNQTPNYNKFCPGGSPTGCVATAMSQIMNYHEWPSSGNGWNNYIPSEHPEYGEQMANFANEVYDWQNMPNELTGSSSEDEIDATAILNYHAGVAVNMNYAPDASGAQTNDVLYAMSSYFKYDPATLELITYDPEEETGYFNKIKTEIDNGRPIYYDGYGESGGHAWVCDGYDDNNKVHINWGWGGNFNGFFLLDNMSPYTYDFTEGNAMIIGIQPGSAYQDMLWTKQASSFVEPARGIDYLFAVNERVAWAIGFDGYGNTDYLKEFTKTTDGNHWESGEINAPETDGYGSSMITAIDENTAWVALYDPNNGGGKIVKTSDGGENWIHQSSAAFAAPNGFPNVVHFWDANNGWCQGDPNGGYFELYTTTDGGNNWTRVPEENIPANQSGEYGTVGFYDVYEDNVWFATNKGRIFKSTDKGYHWEVYQTPLAVSFELSFKNENVGIIQRRGSGDNKVQYITTDGGENWTELNPTGNFYTNSFTYVPDTNILISTGSDYQTPYQGISYSTDDGQTFVEYANFYQNFQFLTLGSAGINATWAGAYSSSVNKDGMWKYGEKYDSLDFTVNKRKVCINDSTIIYNDISMDVYDTYEWDFGDGASPPTAIGSGPHIVKYTSEGSKTVKLVVTQGAIEDSIVKNEFVYAASGIPEIIEISGETEVNVFDTLTYTTTDLNEVNYQWDLPEDWIGSSTKNSIDITFLEQGTQTIRVTPSNVCGEGTPQELEITANCITTNPGIISGETEVRVGETHTYTVPYQDYISYIWDLPNDWSGTSTTNVIEITYGGQPVTDSIKVTSSSVCGEGESTYLTIDVSSGVGINTLKENMINIYPNPNAGNFTLNLEKLKNDENINIVIFNTDGTLLKQINVEKDKKEYNVSLDRKGLFIIRITSNNNQYSLPVIVN